MKQSIFLADFTAGVLSHKLYGRIDDDIYYKGARALFNIRPLPQGGWRCTGGSWWAGSLPDSPYRGIPFVLSESLQFLLLLGTAELRIFPVNSDGTLGAASTLSYGTTYSAEQLQEVQFCQNYNDLYITHRNHSPRVISYSGSTWSYSALSITTNEGEAIPFQSADEYPGCCAFFAGRLWLAGTTAKPQGVWASVPFEPGNFTYYETIETTTSEMTDSSEWVDPAVPEYEDVTTSEDVINDSNAFMFEIASDQNDSIVALSPQEDMVIQTISSEFVVPNDITANNLEAKFTSRKGSSRIQSRMIDGNIIMVQRGRKKLLEYDGDDGFSDLTFYADHITGDGIIQFDFCRTPEQQIFCVLEDGTMAVLIYDTSRDIFAWYPLVHGSANYESVVSVSTKNGEYIYTIMNDGASRWIERLDDDLIVQKAETVTFTAGAGTVSSRLYSEMVQIQEEGEAVTGSSGALSFEDLEGDFAVGLGFTSRFESLNLSPGSEYGPGLLQQKQAVELYLLIYEGKNFSVGTYGDDDEELSFIETYTEKIPLRSGWSDDVGIIIQRDLPFPLEISAMMAEIEVNDK